MNSKTDALFSIHMALFAVLICAISISSCADKKNPVKPISATKLTVNLDSTLDGAGTILASSISTAVLYDTAGTVLKTASVESGSAKFDLTGIAIGDYFITINGLAQERIPTRIDSLGDSPADMIQLVGRTLDAALILAGNDTTFRIKTFFRGQGGRPVRQYSDGADISPEEYAYCIESFGPIPNFEIRIDSTAWLLVREAASGQTSHDFNSWMLGAVNHGKGPAGDPDSTGTQCGGCHTSYTMKPMRWSMISPTRGFCFKCHYGFEGSGAGMIDPTK